MRFKSANPVLNIGQIFVISVEYAMQSVRYTHNHTTRFKKRYLQRNGVLKIEPTSMSIKDAKEAGIVVSRQ